MRGVLVDGGDLTWVTQPKPLLDYLRKKCPFDRFSDEEHNRRWDKTREFMARHNLDALLVSGGNQMFQKAWSNIRYLTEYIGTAEHCIFVVVGKEGEPALCGVAPTYAHRMYRSVIDDIRSSTPAAKLAVKKIKELGVENGRIGLVEPTSRMPVDVWETLRSGLPNATFESVEAKWWKEVRLPLTAEEIKFMKRSGEIGDAILEAIISKAKPGMTEDQVFATMIEAEIANGGEDENMMLIGSHSMLDPDADDTSARPRDRILKKGDIILSEVGPTYDGYEAQVGRPVTLGEPTKEYKAMLDVAFEVYRGIVSKLRIGNHGEEIMMIGDKIDEAGFKNGGPPLIHPLPSGLFGNIPSVPQRGQLDTWRLRFGEAKFEAFTRNMPVCVEISVARQDELAGVFLCDSFIITEGEPMPLYRTPMQNFVR